MFRDLEKGFGTVFFLLWVAVIALWSLVIFGGFYLLFNIGNIADFLLKLFGRVPV